MSDMLAGFVWSRRSIRSLWPKKTMLSTNENHFAKALHFMEPAYWETHMLEK